MEMFYIVTFCVLMPLVVQRPSGILGWIQYLSTAVLQASALPLLGYVSQKSSDKTNILLQETHDMVMVQFDYIIGEQKNDKEERIMLQNVLCEQQQMMAEIHQHITKI